MNNNFKKIISALLSLCILIPLAACGNKTADGQITQMEAPSEVDSQGMVYAADYSTILSDSTQGIFTAVFTDEGILTTRNVFTGTRELYEGEKLEYEGQLDVWESRIFLCGYDGTERELDYRPITPEQEIPGHQYSQWISSLALTDKGFVVIEDDYENWSDAPEGTAMYSDEWYAYQKTRESYVIRSFDMDCREIARADIAIGQMDNGDYFYPYSTLVTDDGSILIAGEGGVRVFTAEGTLKFNIDCASWVENLIKLRDGRIFGLYYGDTSYCASEIDIEKRSFGDPIPMPNNCYSCFTGGGDYDFCYTSGSNLYGFKLNEEKAEKLFNWINIDVNSNNISSVSCDKDGNIVGLLNTWNSDYTNCTTELVKVSKRPASEIPEKIHLTLACQYIDWNIQNRIIEYNRGNGKYHVDVLDYSEYNTEEDYSAGMTKLTTELLSGSMPDILFLSGMPEEKLAAKGLLEDLYTFIDNDPDMNRSDFFPSVLKAKEVDGKLYSTVSGFSLSLVAGASSVVGDEPGWNFDEFYQAYSRMPEGCTIFSQTMTQSDLMYNYLPAVLSDYVDKSTGDCNFNSEGFISFLKFVTLFPKDFDWEKFDWTEYEEDSARIMSGRQMLSNVYMSSFNDIQYTDYQFGGAATFIGYPTQSGTGNMFNIEPGYAISTGCTQKEAAWDFLRVFFTPDYQLEMYNFPSNMSAFDSMAEKAMTPDYLKDGNGNYVLDENGEKIKQSLGGFATETGETYEIYEVSAEQVDRIRRLIETTTRVSGTSDDIVDIIISEAEPFFQGQKSAEEVAKLIQSKVNILINEQR